MGYEITYHYHERDEEGNYNTEEKKQLKRKVGKAFDDTPLGSAAKAILSQLARRDIWVVGVDITELVKKEITFKESKDGHGIVLKGKKFTIENTEGEIVEEDEENLVAPRQVSTTPSLRNVSVDSIPLTPDQANRTLFRVIFDPELQDRPAASRYNLTIDNKYSVHRQRENPMGGQFGSLYTITDDKGEIIEIDEKYFMIAPQGLMGGSQFNEDLQQQSAPKLLYQDAPAAGGGAVVDRSQIPQEYAHLPIDGEAESYQMPPMDNIRPGYTPPKATYKGAK